MSEQAAAPVVPVEMPDPFQGGEPTFEEFSEFRKSGVVPDRFKPSTDGEAAKEAPETPKKEEVKTVDGQEPPKETEQEKEARERDEKGKFKAKVELTPEQQEVFDKSWRKREGKIRREYEDRIAAMTSSSTQATAAEKKPENAAATSEPQRPELPKLSTYKGTVEEFEKELSEFPAKQKAFDDFQRQRQEHSSSLQKRLVDSESKAKEAFPDYEEAFQSLAEDIKNNEEPILPPHVLKAIAEEAEDPHGLTYHLAKNRDEFRRLAALAPEQALREVLRLDARLSMQQAAPAPAKDQPKPKPKPPEPVGVRATATAFDVNDEKMDADEWARNRNEQVSKRRR